MEYSASEYSAPGFALTGPGGERQGYVRPAPEDDHHQSHHQKFSFLVNSTISRDQSLHSDYKSDQLVALRLPKRHIPRTLYRGVTTLDDLPFPEETIFGDYTPNK
jgi:hypothetical protein